MAGAIPITLRPAEGEMLRSLNDVRLSEFLTELDEWGWTAARDLLPGLADEQQHENNKRSREIDDDGTCGTTASVGR